MEDFKDRIQAQYDKMLAFQKEHELYLYPQKPLLELVELIIKRNGFCPCFNKRPECPCKEAINEIKLEGKCACGIFYNKEKYEETWGWLGSIKVSP